MVFVNSMSDLFHEDVPDAYIDNVASVMARGQLAHLSGSDEASGAGCANLLETTLREAR